jgi:hypothetical protein
MNLLHASAWPAAAVAIALFIMVGTVLIVFMTHDGGS